MSDEQPPSLPRPSSSAGIASVGAHEVTLPSHFVIRREIGLFQLSWRWKTHAKASVFLTSALPALGLGYFAVFAPGAAVALATLGVGVGSVGYQLARWGFNTVRLRAEHGGLFVDHGPLPWRGLALSAREIQGLDVEEDGRVPKGWSVYVRSNGKRQLLVGMLETADQARFIEKCIEEQLQIQGVSDVVLDGQKRAAFRR